MKRRNLLTAALAGSAGALLGASPSRAAYGEVVVRGLTSDQYHDKFLQLKEKGLMPVWIDATQYDGDNYFSAIWRPSTAPWVAKRNMTGQEYQDEFDTHVRNGYRLTNVRSYREGSKDSDPLYAAIWRKESGPPFVAYHGLNMAAHQYKFEQLTRDGWAPLNLSVVHLGTEREVTGLYVHQDVGGLWALQTLEWNEVDQAVAKAETYGLQCVYLTSWDTISSADAYSIIFWGYPPGSQDTVVKHEVFDSQVDTELDYYTVQRDYLTRCITGSSGHGGGFDYSLVFRRP
ncbi:MAG TPA: hypothetical protein VF062_12620 [Candidatus Limnocylindrales bacterium]